MDDENRAVAILEIPMMLVDWMRANDFTKDQIHMVFEIAQMYNHISVPGEEKSEEWN